MVTKSGTIPSGPTPMKTLPPTEHATVASGGDNSRTGSGADVANRDRTGESSFSLPEKVTASEVRDQSYRYGGGRSAGKGSTRR